MAVSLEDYLKDSKTIQAARKKYAAAQAALVTAQRASQGLPTGGSEALRSQVERRLADAQIQLDEAEKSLRQEESVQTKFTILTSIRFSLRLMLSNLNQTRITLPMPTLCVSV